MTEPSVSVIIPTYNRAHLIERAISSVLSQLSEGDGVIVVDDGSTDNTQEVVAQFGPAVSYHLVSNGGAGAARNYGISLARGDLVAFLDSDDEWMPGKLDLQKIALQAIPDALFCFGDFAIRTATDQEIRHACSTWHRDQRTWNDILGKGQPISSLGTLPGGVEDFLLHRGSLYTSEIVANYIFTGTIVVRREAAGDALRFSEDTPTFEDWECYGRLAGAGEAIYLDRELAWQHGHEGVRLTDANLLESTAARITITERVWGADESFLLEHGDLYRRIIDEQRQLRAAEFIASGQVSDARNELRLMSRAPLLYQLLSWLPGGFAKTLFNIKKSLNL